MKEFEYHELLPAHFSNASRVWIYQSDRIFSPAESVEVKKILLDFVGGWQSHGKPVKGYAHLFFGQFIVLMADEAATGVSGCSTDSSVRQIKEIETRFSVDLFDRQLLAFLINDKIQLLPFSQLNYAVENNSISPDTHYFNNLVDTKEELEKHWIIPVKDSWLAKKLSLLSHDPVQPGQKNF